MEHVFLHKGIMKKVEARIWKDYQEEDGYHIIVSNTTKNKEIIKKNQKVKALPSDFLDNTDAKARSIDYFVKIHMFRITNQKSFHIHYPDRHLPKQVKRPEYSIIIANDYIKSSIMPSIMCM